MKRSKAVRLVMMGSAVLGLAGCKPKAETYPSAQACADAGEHTEAECNEAFAAARREHEATARHFDSRDQCVATYGPDGCEERPREGGGSFFMPMMLGYMLGNSLGYHPLYRDPQRFNGLQAPGGGSTFSGYSSRSGGGFGGSRFGSGGSPSGGETSTVSRGGFGSSGMFGGSGGE